MVEKKIFKLVLQEDEITWQSLLMDIIKAEGMDPWNIDVTKITQSYIKILKKLKEANLKVSGKVILASAILLKIKSKRLLGEEIAEFDRIMQQAQMTEEDLELGDDMDILDMYGGRERVAAETKLLVPRTPQPRKRKVSIYDLVDALDKAMVVRKRRVERQIPLAGQKIVIPETKDITDIIVEVYDNIKEYYNKKHKKILTFSHLIPDDDRESKVLTFIPLLYLQNEKRVTLNQETPFGEIEVKLRKRPIEID